MKPSAQRFDQLLRELETARFTDDALHRANASLAERTASHDMLLGLRAEIAKARFAFESDAITGRTSRDTDTGA